MKLFPNGRFKIIRSNQNLRIERIKSIAIKDLLPVLLTISFLVYMIFRSNYMSDFTLFLIGGVILFNFYKMIEPIKELISPPFFEFDKAFQKFNTVNFSRPLSDIECIEMLSLFNGENNHKFSLKLRFVDGSSHKLDYSGNEEELADYAHEISKFINKPIQRS